MERPVDLSVIVVNWNTRAYLADCLASIQEQAGELSLEVWVVDNGSSDGSAQMVERQFPWVRLLANERNLGFAQANNQALRLARGRYALLLNSDTVILGHALTTLIAFMDEHPDAGAAGCKLLNSDGSLQTSGYSFPNLLTILASAYGLKRLFPVSSMRKGLPGRVLAGRLGHLSEHDRVRSVDFVTGACLMIRRQASEVVGLLDETFFLYLEEIDYCRRIKGAGWQIYFVPQARVVHHIGRSSEQSEDTLAWLYRSRCYYFQKHHGRLAALLLRTLVLPSLAFQLGRHGLTVVRSSLKGQARSDGEEAWARQWKAVQACILPWPTR